MVTKPTTQNSESAKELERVGEQFDKFNDDLEKMNLDRMNQAPKKELEPQTLLSSTELAKSQSPYLKPFKIIGCADKFNENYRKDYEFQKEYVQFIAENKEIIGETIEMWTRPFAGMPAEFWKVPVNKPIWGPRYLAEQLKRCNYHRFVMGAPRASGTDGTAQYYDSVAVDTTVQRLDAIPVNEHKSIFMGTTKLGI